MPIAAERINEIRKTREHNKIWHPNVGEGIRFLKGHKLRVFTYEDLLKDPVRPRDELTNKPLLLARDSLPLELYFSKNASDCVWGVFDHTAVPAKSITRVLLSMLGNYSRMHDNSSEKPWFYKLQENEPMSTVVDSDSGYERVLRHIDKLFPGTVIFTWEDRKS